MLLTFSMYIDLKIDLKIFILRLKCHPFGLILVLLARQKTGVKVLFSQDAKIKKRPFDEISCDTIVHAEGKSFQSPELDCRKWMRGMLLLVVSFLTRLG